MNNTWMRVGGKICAAVRVPRRVSISLSPASPAHLSAQRRSYREQFFWNIEVSDVDVRKPRVRWRNAWENGAMELPEQEVCYRALQSRDSRFDGLLFVGVTSTGISPEFVNDPRLTHVFPEEKRLARAKSIEIGMPAARKSALKEPAEAAIADPNLFRPLGTIEETITRLRGIPGIGEWTAQYIALRALRETDAFPATDIGLLRGAERVEGAAFSPSALLARSESWRPWRAYAAQHLWTADTKLNSKSRSTHV
jgi:hypothetical protein